MSLSSYLAQKYLTASTPASDPSKPSSGKKRKRKQAASSGLIIADDDDLGWSNSNSNPNNKDDDGRPITISSGSAEFRKAKKNAWKTVGVPVLQPTQNHNDDEEAAAANRIIAGVVEENSASRAGGDEDPTVEDEEGILKMGDGTHAGLQSAASVAAQYAKRKKEEAARWAAEGGSSKGAPKEETVYRDATGRRIDIGMRKKEARREAEEKEKAEREEEEAQKGDVQRKMKEKRKEELDEARFMPLARGIEDVEMNRELKEKERWDDPAMQFLIGKGKGKGKSVSGKPLYAGAAPPNRYNIRPGHRWDGVDRSIGFEAKRFKAMNRTVRNKDLSHNWEQDT